MSDLAAQLATELKTALDARGLDQVAFSVTEDDTAIYVNWCNAPPFVKSGCDKRALEISGYCLRTFAVGCAAKVARNRPQ